MTVALAGISARIDILEVVVRKSKGSTFAIENLASCRTSRLDPGITTGAGISGDHPMREDLRKREDNSIEKAMSSIFKNLGQVDDPT